MSSELQDQHSGVSRDLVEGRVGLSSLNQSPFLSLSLTCSPQADPAYEAADEKQGMMGPLLLLTGWFLTLGQGSPFS